jgi:hypothetical protein
MIKLRCFAFGVLFISLSYNSFSQRFKGGLLLGFNASQVDGDTYAGFDKFGIMGGAYVYTPISPLFDIQMEIKYMGKGARKRTSEVDLTQYQSNLNYIEIPVLLRLNTKNKIGLEAGLGFGYLFSYSLENEYGVLPLSETPKFRSFELSYIVGIGYQFAPKFSVNLRYSYSVISIAKTPEVAYTYFRRSGLYNNLFSLGIYYSIGK